MASIADLRRAVLEAEMALDRQERTRRGLTDLASALQGELDQMGETERLMSTGLFYAGQLNLLTHPDFGRLVQESAAQAEAVTALETARAALATARAAEPPIWTDSAPVPAVLVPVRLEVRYQAGAGVTELAIRVVPDDIAVHTFEPELTDAEHAAGARYLDEVARPDATDESRAAAWRTILAELGAARAAWTVEVMGVPAEADMMAAERAEIGHRPSSWNRAATSLVLPDRFTFRGWRRGRLVFDVTGADVPGDLTLGPDPAGLGAPRADGDETAPLAWTGTSAWMVDFDEAVRVGMGVRIPLSGTDLSLDEVVVVGVAGHAPDAAAERLAATLQGHLYTRGLAFPPHGAPTNNTSATRSDWSTSPTMRTPGEAEGAVATEQPGSGQPAVRVADVLGFPAASPPAVRGRPGRRDLLIALGGTSRDDDALGRRAHDLVTTFYADFSRISADIPEAGGGWLTSPAIRRHFQTWVRARGPLPSIRVGKQPYGMLPVTPLSFWSPSAAGDPDADPDVPDDIVARLRLLRAAIGRQLASSPRIGRGTDQDEILLGLLRRLPESVGVRSGRVGIRERDTPGPHPMAGGLPLLDWQDMAFRGLAPPGSPALLSGPLVGVVSFGRALVAEAETAAAAWDGAEPEPPTGPLFQRLLDFIGPLENIDVSSAGLFWYLAVPAAFWRTLAGCSWAFERRKAELRGDAAAVAEMDAAMASAKGLLDALASFEADVAADQGAVDREIARAIEALTCRVDAWATSLATARLDTVRRSSPTGIRLGAYGWLVDVRPTPPALRAGAAGWVLAPSLHHATTSAVLHSGWAAHAAPEAFAVDLTSRRVRRAQATLAALRQGRTLEELLGYQLERELHDLHLDRFVAALRSEFPLPAAATEPGDEAGAAAGRQEHGRRLVADGDAVRRRGPDLAVAAGPFAGATDDELVAVRAVLAGLEETVDAMGDVLLAEGVHQLVGGSPLRAGLAADTVGRANPIPDRLDVVRTPRRSVAVNHTVALAVAPAPGGAWSPSPRADVDPVAEAVGAWALGEPTDWTVTIVPPDGGPADSCTLADLGVSAIDVVAEATRPLDDSALAARARLARGGTGVVDVARADGLGGREALPALAGAVRTMLGVARPAGASAAALDQFGSSGVAADLSELASRVATWWAAVQAALAAWPVADLPDQEAAMTVLARLGLAGARFDAPAALGAALHDRWGGVVLPRRPPPPPSSPEVAAWLASLRSDLVEATGGWTVAAPLWTAAAEGWDTLGGEAPTGAPVGDDDVDDWLRDHRDVRAAVTSLLDLLAITGACGGGDGTWEVRQHRPAPGHVALPEGWVARDHPGPRSASHLASLVVGEPAPGPRALLLVDQWLETVPARPTDPSATAEDVAALGFRFDRPDARAPHAVLVVAPPDLRLGWCLEDVHAAVEETLWWAQARPLDSDDLPELRWGLG